MDVIRTSGKNGIQLEEYKGQYSILAMQEGKDGAWYKVWCKRQIGKDKFADTVSPVKDILGDKQTALAALQSIMGQIEPDHTPF